MDVDLVMKFEDGSATNREALTLLSSLIRSGRAWTLQGFYGRAAQSMIDAGYIDDRGFITKKGTVMLDEVEPLADDAPCTAQKGCSSPAIVTRPMGPVCAGHDRLMSYTPGAEFAANH